MDLLNSSLARHGSPDPIGVDLIYNKVKIYVIICICAFLHSMLEFYACLDLLIALVLV